MSSTRTPEGSIEILARIVQPGKGGMSPDAAESILGMQLPEDDRERLNQLAAKAREGKLSQEERALLDEYERVTAMLELMQSRARLSLKQAGFSS